MKCSLGVLLANKKEGNTRPACNLIWSSFTAFYIPQKNRKLLFRSLACPASGNLAAAAVEWATGLDPLTLLIIPIILFYIFQAYKEKLRPTRRPVERVVFFCGSGWFVGKK